MRLKRDILEDGRGREEEVLLRRYVEEGSGEAFGELVGRHIGSVYGHAERVMRDPGLAEDVTQAVFLLLAERAGSLYRNPKVPLVGWLYTVTHFTCANALRGERRRRLHEKEAGRMVALRSEVKRESEVEEHLDRIMQGLGRKERDVILLRYVHDYSLAEIGGMMGMTEGGAKKRLLRAMKKVRARFAEMGVTVPAEGLAGAVLAGGVVPGHLAGVVACVGLKGGVVAPVVVSLARGGMHMLLAAKMKLVAVVVLIVGVAVGIGGIVVGQSLGKGESPKVVAVAAASAPSTMAAATQSSVASGTVLDAAGKPMGNAFVSIVEWGRSDPVVVASTRSDAGGVFSFAGPLSIQETQDNRFEIFADVPGVGFSKSDIVRVSGKHVLRLAAGAEAQVPLIGVGGKGAGGMKVFPTFINFDALEGQIIGPYLPLPLEISKRWTVTADAEGVAVFRGVPQHSRLRLDVDDESVAQLGFRSGVLVGGDAVIRTAAVQLEAGCAIEGTVKYAENGRPAADIHVSTGTIMNQLISGDASGRGTTDENGHYRMERLKAGKYVVYTDLDEVGEYTAVAPEVTATGGGTVSADIGLIHGGILAGMVRDKVTGKGIGGLRVALQGPSRPKEANAVLSHETDKEGRFSFRVPPGEQHVQLQVMQVEGYVVPNMGGPQIFPAKEVKEPVVVEGGKTEFNIELAPDVARSISGTVMDANGNPAAGAIVLYEGPDAMMEQSRTVTTDAQGRFTISGFKKGAVLRARRAEGSAEATLKGMTLNSADDEVVVELSATGTFSLVVKTVGVDGKAVPNATMNLIKWGSRSGMSGMPLAVNADGTIEYENLYKDYRYAVTGTAPGYGEAQAAVKSPGEADVQETVTVTLKKADTPIGGTVRDESGKEMADVEVQRNGANGAAITRTDAGGHFRFMVAEGSDTTVFVRGAKPPGKSARAGDTDVDFVVSGGGK